ncbi:hypothetical protein [Cohnella nanjingensis]|uniref:Lipoprotein n=1 Tax=Cohnella nanjingensis TaxID=1387779 RepID=A0A7X0RRS8_9BACL|nr:hypothetical protein [Cohnella nanjingensis]MBB6672467.1 hypothetical protein [Cohnella nanjingensis]
MRKRARAFIGLIAAAAMAIAPFAAYAEGGTQDAAAREVAPIQASTSAELAANLGVLKGDGGGVTDAYLDKRATRLQSAILYLRLLGKEAEALGESGTDSFADASAVGVSGKPILAYLKAHPELGWQGTTGGRFDPNAPITAQQLYKVMLEALGYASASDFAYADTLAFASGQGLRRIAGVGELTNRDLGVALVEALQAKPKGGEDTLARKLEKAGALAPDRTAGLTASRIDASRAADGTTFLTDGEGRALYLFTKDTVSLEACLDGCLANWPVFSADKLIVADGLAAKDFGVHVRADGTKQVTYRGWPLYYFVKDKPGDTFGEGVGGVWYLIKKPFYTTSIGTDAKLGNYLTDTQGRTLYYFDKDPSGSSVCSGACLANWPAFHADAATVPSGLKPSDFGEIVREDGAKQSTFKGYPLYYFAKDAERGDTYGQGIGGVWFVIDPAKFDGTTAGRASS